ncbi:hypothetical protein [Sporolactobacillus putidus]|uniref:Uncharacterized protein n=1 Tax=Sporolactobacillus putidus TaxID=492735 RepID=A0A917S215_9BACL|nr:hypothetical protein [Sporolactobacillus putidus]GGL51928.1 hypothetical protein GCM10007968_15110 [Sporolactobacillus putidus]
MPAEKQKHSRIKESSLILFNVLSRTETIEKAMWLERAEILKIEAVKHGLYPVGPLVMTSEQMDPLSARDTFTFYLPLNGSLKADPEAGFVFQPSLMLEHTLSLRHDEEGKPFSVSHRELQAFARQHGFSCSSVFYHVMIAVYGEWYAEIHLPVSVGGLLPNGQEMPVE